MKWFGIIIIVLISGLVTRAQDSAIRVSFQQKSYDAKQIEYYYQLLEPQDIKPSYKVFYGGLIGYGELRREGKIQNNRYLTLIDFSLSSKVRRLWVIDMETFYIVHNSLVSHGKNSGKEYAVQFSNINNSYMSSIGFYLTGTTYSGKHGHSLYLEGLEEGVNNNARKRAIVMHGADYATRDFINKNGRLGRSFGCPALPPAKSSAIIDTIKNKSCLFIYFPDNKYLVNSKYINPI